MPRIWMTPTVIILIIIGTVLITDKNSDVLLFSTLAPVATLISILVLVSWFLGYKNAHNRERRPRHQENRVVFPHEKIKTRSPKSPPGPKID